MRIVKFIAVSFIATTIALESSVAKAQDPLDASQSKEAQEWRVLLIIKPETDLRLKDQPPIKTKIAADNITAVKKAFLEYTPYWVSKVSEGRLRWKAEAVISPTPVTAVSEMGKGTYWVAPWNIPEDIQKFVPPGIYDGVFVYWKAAEEKGNAINTGFGWSIGPHDAANNCGYTCVHYANSDLWGRDSEFTEVFLHEWLHQLEGFYGSKGVKLPKGGLHGATAYGYEHHPTQFWKPWYRDFIAGDVRESDGSKTGLGEKAWSLGTIRDEQRIFTPQYLTPELKKQNLFRNGSFEGADLFDWTFVSWRGITNSGKSVSVVAHDGKQKNAAVLNAAEADDLGFRQKIPVKPKTRYLCCGWAKTEGVTVVEQGGTIGANLSVWGGYEHSSFRLTGTTDWTYLSFIFDSGERTTVEVGVRLGFYSSTVTGKAWFDDICLIEIPEKAAK
jgi:hypothetical protein